MPVTLSPGVNPTLRVVPKISFAGRPSSTLGEKEGGRRGIPVPRILGGFGGMALLMFVGVAMCGRAAVQKAQECFTAAPEDRQYNGLVPVARFQSLDGIGFIYPNGDIRACALEPMDNTLIASPREKDGQLYVSQKIPLEVELGYANSAGQLFITNQFAQSMAKAGVSALTGIQLPEGPVKIGEVSEDGFVSISLPQLTGGAVLPVGKIDGFEVGGQKPTRQEMGPAALVLVGAALSRDDDDDSLNDRRSRKRRRDRD